MGIVSRTVEEVTCDLCGNACGKRDGEINIQVNSGDGRDVGSGRLVAELKLNQPYGVQGGIICNSCKCKWVRIYAEGI